MQEIIIITDYKGYFGSKHNASPYRSGMDIDLLKMLFEKNNFIVTIENFAKISFSKNYENTIVIYTGSEDHNLLYKSYIEDVILGLQNLGAMVIPGFDFLKANNNKVYMEILRNRIDPANRFNTKFFGTLQELKDNINTINPPVILKKSAGAMSKGVFLAKTKEEVIKNAKKISQTKNLLFDIKDKIRRNRHKGYIPESTNRNKFIVQNFIPDLNNDWKVLVFFDKCFILKRTIKPGDFRASGSGYQYKFDVKAEFPQGIFDFCIDYKNKLNVPNISLDVAFDGKEFFIIEFQALYFGTTTQEKSKYFFQKEKNTWIPKTNNFSIEEIFVYGIKEYYSKKA